VGCGLLQVTSIQHLGLLHGQNMDICSTLCPLGCSGTVCFAMGLHRLQGPSTPCMEPFLTSFHTDLGASITFHCNLQCCLHCAVPLDGAGSAPCMEPCQLHTFLLHGLLLLLLWLQCSTGSSTWRIARGNCRPDSSRAARGFSFAPFGRFPPHRPGN